MSGDSIQCSGHSSISEMIKMWHVSRHLFKKADICLSMTRWAVRYDSHIDHAKGFGHRV
jgi:hypothetical protein